MRSSSKSHKSNDFVRAEKNNESELFKSSKMIWDEDDYDEDEINIESFGGDEDDSVKVIVFIVTVNGKYSRNRRRIGKRSKDDEWSTSRAFRGSCRR